MSTGPKSKRATAAAEEDLGRWRERTRRQQSAIVRLATSREFALGPRGRALALATEVGAQALLIARCSVWFLEDDDHFLDCHELFELETGAHGGGMRLAADEYPAYFVALRSGRAIDAHDAQHDERTSEFTQGYLEKIGITSMLDAAIRVGGRIVGVVCCEHVGPPRVWQPDEISFAGEVADQVANLIVGEQKRQADAERDSLWMQLTESERLRTLGTLAAGIAHDFNNILTPILAHAELAQLSLDPDDPAYDHLAPIVENAAKARALVRQLLAVGRRETSNMTGSCDLGRVAGEVLDLARASIPPDVAFVREIAPGPVLAAVDASQAQQVVLNLVVNAGQAIGDRSGVLSARVRMEEEQQGAWAVLEVEDDGVGMDEATRRRIFEPFFSTRSAGGGSGLGLAVVYGIVEGCGGSIEVRSSPGTGSCFTVRIPSAAALPDALAELQSDDPVAMQRVLIVDDEPAVAAVLQAQLRRGGHDVVTCSSPGAALELFARDPDRFDVLIADYTMPVMSGSQLLRRVRELRPALSTLLLSGLALESIKDADYVDEVLMKPLRIEELESAMRRLARRR